MDTRWNGHVFLLPLLVIAVLHHGTVNCDVELDMALDAVDDKYTGCRDVVLKKVLESGLRKELAASPEFQAAWTANKDCPPVVPPGGLTEHGQALLAFVHGGKAFRDTFNHAVKTMGGNTSFPFQSLHFLLMDAMALLQKKKEKDCRTVYAVFPRRYSVRHGATVRFGEFMGVTSDLSWLQEEPDLEGGVLFNVTSCFVLDLQKYTCEAAENNMALLLSPAEFFTVVDVVKWLADDDNYSHTRISLKHMIMGSKHNCYLDPRAQKGSSTAVVLGSMWGVYLTVAVLGLFN